MKELNAPGTDPVSLCRTCVLEVLADGQPMRPGDLVLAVMQWLKAETPSLHWRVAGVALMLRCELSEMIAEGLLTGERDHSEEAGPDSVVIRLAEVRR